MKFVIIFLLSLCAFSFCIASDNTKKIPALLLAKTYQSNIKLEDYWVSEKLDGVRGFWNGQNFISRQGNVIKAPEWFSSVLPNTALDGELWLGRGQFEELSGIVRREIPTDSDWRKVKFMIFDLPGSPKVFNERLIELNKIISEINAPHVQLIKQFKIPSHQVLSEKLDEIVKQGAEGLMLHLGSSFYTTGRSNDLLKLKKYQDAEAVVVGHIAGEGKYLGMLGSIEVETIEKKRFKIGTGFSDKERKNPPAIGAVITYKYFGVTGNGLPRFASFMRIRTSY